MSVSSAMFEQEVNLEDRRWSRLNKMYLIDSDHSRTIASSDTYESKVPISQPREPKSILSWRIPDFIDLMILVKL